MNEKKNKQPEMLPLTSDLLNLRNILLKAIERLTSKEGVLSYSDWNDLQKITVTRLITFNAR